MPYTCENVLRCESVLRCGNVLQCKNVLRYENVWDIAEIWFGLVEDLGNLSVVDQHYIDLPWITSN